MGEPSHVPVSGPTYRGTLSGDGRPGPIEVRLGRRLVRLIDAESLEGTRLLASGQVDLIGPDGTRLGTMRAADALRRLRDRIEQRLASVSKFEQFEREMVEDGLDRLDEWILRLNH